jgi:hypothetical protein
MIYVDSLTVWGFSNSHAIHQALSGGLHENHPTDTKTNECVKENERTKERAWRAGKVKPGADKDALAA